jgi:hypothetical protein
MEAKAGKNTDSKETVTEIPQTTPAFVIFVFKKIMEKKKYWLIPFWSLLLAIALILFLTGNGALLPAIYMAF